MLTLHLLVQAFIGATVTVDCKDGAAATGTVVSADCDMK
jgi:small nuclear ribonucleoprotein (snRNP)-like protein